MFQSNKKFQKKYSKGGKHFRNPNEKSAKLYDTWYMNVIGAMGKRSTTKKEKEERNVSF